MPTVERRREPRISAQLPLQFTFGGKTIDSRIEDLSNSGIRFRTPAALPVMSRMQISLELPDSPEAAAVSPISIVGVVVRCEQVRSRGEHPFDAAIFFEDVSPASARDRLTRFVRQRVASA
jgi:c-di-GMP-binding flagellar brake protein YcgR